MPDSWERRALPNVRGWNNPLSVLTFMVTYDSGLDVLTIVASHPVLSMIDAIGWELDTPATGALSSGQFTIVNETTITIATASVSIGSGALTQLDFFNAGPLLVGIWTGSITLAAVPVEPGVVGTGLPAFVDSVNGEIPFDCANVSTAVLNAAYAILTTGIADPIYGAEILFKDGGTVQFTPDTTNVLGYGAGYFAFYDGVLIGRQVDTIQIIDAGLAPVGDPFSASAGDYWMQVATIDIAGADATVTFSGLDPDVMPAYPGNMDRLQFTGCSENGGGSGDLTIYDPAGPNAGLNPGGITYVQWDIDAIVIEGVTGLLAFTTDVVSVRSGNGSYHWQGFVADWPP